MNRFLASGQAIMFGTVLLLFPVLAQAQGSYEAGDTGTYQDATTATNVVLNQPLAGGTAESTTDEDRGWRLRLDLSWGVILGLDVPLGDSDWVVNANVRYLNTGTKFSSVDFALDGNYDPIILSLGVGYRF